MQKGFPNYKIVKYNFLVINSENLHQSCKLRIFIYFLLYRKYISVHVSCSNFNIQNIKIKV